MQNTRQANVTGSVFLALGILLIMATPAYADRTGDKSTEQATPNSQSKDEAMVDLYDDGALMLHAASQHRKITPIATAASIDYLMPLPARAKSLTAKKIGNTIIIEATKPVVDAALPVQTAKQQMADLPSPVASQPVVASPKLTATRITRSKDVISMNGTQE
jgi:hypothetical protein